jgi:hypothetical protein
MSQSDAAPLPESGKPKLLDQVRHPCRLRHLALSTEHSYVGWIRREEPGGSLSATTAIAQHVETA